MLAMQYSVRLPEDFDTKRIYEHVAARSPLFDGLPGLRHKFYLYDAEEHVYAPFYIWENAKYAQEFLLNSLFKGVIETFGRPRVRSWHIIEFDYGSSKEEPTFLRSAIDKVPANMPLSELMKQEKERQKKMLDAPGLFARMVLLDPDRWEKGQFSLWRKADDALPVYADCVYGYDILKSYQHLQGAA